MSDAVKLLQNLYERFNARDMESLLAAMHPDVIWANGMEGGHVHGREGVRGYWTRQWAIVDPHVEPIEFSHGIEGEVIVKVHQLVRDLAGTSLRIGSSAMFSRSKTLPSRASTYRMPGFKLHAGLDVSV